MAELGNIFNAAAPSEGTQRGLDLRLEVTVPRADLGRPGGIEVHVPLRVGDLRRADPHGDGERLRITLPADAPDGTTLRVRGLGALTHEEGDGGAPPRPAGDLYLVLRLVETPRPGQTHRRRMVPWLVAAVLVLLALGLVLLPRL